jgi:predicted enzyme related to lactoylglutathione lyase
MSKPVVHFEIGGRDLGKLVPFYQQLFGWDIANYGQAAMINSHTGVTGHMTALGHEPHNYVTVYVASDDLEGDLNKVKELGGKVVVPPTKIPGSTFAWFQDPEGNLLGLLKSDAKA